MQNRSRTLSSLTVALCLLCACGAPVERSEPETPPVFVPLEPIEPPPAPRPWTESFRSSALLIADEVRIEGPKGLLDHIATRIEPDFHTYVAETLPEGFQQTFEPRRADAGIDIRAYFDALEVVALKRLVLLERPGEVDVVVQAAGDAFWRESATGREQRGSLLRFVGTRPE
jgi:hypothetical protein